MRIIARRTLRQFVESLSTSKDRPAVKAALDAWFDEVSKATWKNTADVKRRYATASIVSSPTPATASRACKTRSALVIDESQLARLVNRGGLGMHLQFPIDALDVSLDRVAR